MKSRIVCLAILTLALQTATGALDFSKFDSQPIQEGGRKKPWLVFAQESLLSLSGKDSFVVEEQKMSANEILIRIWTRDRNWEEIPMILFDYLPLKEECGFPADRKHFSYSELSGNARIRELLQEAAAARARDSRSPLRGSLKEASTIGLRLALFESLSNGTAFRIVPDSGPAWALVPRTQPEFVRLTTALKADDPVLFESALEDIQLGLATVSPKELPPAWLIDLEVLYQKTHPFRLAWISLALSAIVLAVTSTVARKAGYRLGVSLAVLGTLMMIAGFAIRVTVSGRAPVTNMYESILWVAFGTVGLALFFEFLYRSRYFLLAASPVAVISLMIADAAPMKFPSGISPLVPVLQSNFWLTTHVLTITLSYAAFALALGVAHIALGKVLFRGTIPGGGIYNYVYRCLQVGVLLLASGTVLGAVWANYSWGRFWDWDPKETWALIALLGYLFILHGRIAGKWGGFGLCVGAVLGFQSVVMAWYGVNFVLGAGLHSYGFGSGGLGWAVAFVIAELIFTGLALIRYGSLRNSSKVSPVPMTSESTTRP